MYRPFIVCFVSFAFINVVYSAYNNDTITAHCTVEENSGSYPINGTITLKQPSDGGNISIEIILVGFNVSASPSSHGFHVHQYGNLSEKCMAAGGHFNPTGKDHGAPEDEDRHVGDLGNVETNAAGEVRTTITDHVVSLVGNWSVIGKAIVIHAGKDDLGRGNFSDSKTTGHAGARYGCCIITVAATASLPTAYSVAALLLLSIFTKLLTY